MKEKKPKKIKKELTIEQKIKRRNFISFTVFGAFAAGAHLAAGNGYTIRPKK